MPKENKARGRRKRKHDADEPQHEDLEVEQPIKRRRASNDAVESGQQDVSLEEELQDVSPAYPPNAHEPVFFGMLDEQEQEYFKHADELLELDQFGSQEERALFLENVYREAEGKELKIAQSQSCSRLLERLIKQSKPSQLRKLFQQFSGNFIHLLCHRFASHCCEALFAHAAPFVTEELLAPEQQGKGQDDSAADPNEVFVSMENLYLHTLAELEGNIGFLMTDQYASHALRVLLLVLSGESIWSDSAKTLVRSKKKENVGGAMNPTKNKDNRAVASRTVPKSFSTALEKLIRDSITGLDTAKLRALATHQNANPTLQLLLRLEMAHYGKQHAKNQDSIIKKLLPDDPFTSDCESAAFLSGLAYDPIGAHLVERIIENAPSKLFKMLYQKFFKERLATFARNEVGTYIDCRILERLGYDDLLEAHEILLPVIPVLLERRWTALTRVLIERCTVREIDTQAIAVQIDQFYQGPKGFDLVRMLELGKKSEAIEHVKKSSDGEDDTNAVAPQVSSNFVRIHESSKVHFNILAQAMLIVPGSLSALILESLIALGPDMLLTMAEDFVATRTLQQALTTKNASIIERRKLIQQFYGHIGEMALEKSASHVVDCIWVGTHGLAFIRERIAEELAENESQIRDSPCGRAVWKNWKMDLYKRRRPEWVRQSKIKASNDGFQSFSELDQVKESGDAPKTPLQLARERHMRNKAKQEDSDKDPAGRAGQASNSNALAPTAATASV